MHKFMLIIMLCAIIASVFSGCYDAREVDAVAHALVLGIDKGVSDKWRLTLQLSTMKEVSDGGEGVGGSQDDYTYITVDAPSFFTGINMLNASVPRELTFMHAQLIVISEDLAREGIIGAYIAPLIRFREIRRSAHLVVTKGSALDFIKANNPFIGTTLSKSLQAAFQESYDTGYFIHATLDDFYNDLKSPHRQPAITMGAVNNFGDFNEKGAKWGNEFKPDGEYLAGQLPRTGQNKIEYWGTALFDRDKMVAELNGAQTRALLMIRGKFKRGFFSIQDPKQPDSVIPLDVRQTRKPEIKISFNEGISTIQLTIHLGGDLLSVQSRLHYEEDPLLSLLEDTFKGDIKNQIDELINKCKNLNIDVFGFGDVASRKFWTIDEWEKYGWSERFKDAKITTQVNFTLEGTGTQIKSSPIPD